MPRPLTLTRHACLLLAALCSIASSLGINEKTIERRSLKLIDTLAQIQTRELSRIPSAIMKEAKGIIILRQYEAGLVFGGKGGYGVAMVRDINGNWGPPAWIKTGEGSWGLQIGVQKLQVVLLLMDKNVLTLLDQPKFRIGVDAGATAGPAGSNVEAKVGRNTPIFIYEDSHGLYAGASLEGGFLIPANKANTLTYEIEHSVPQIISGNSVPMPPFGALLADKLTAIEQGR